MSNPPFKQMEVCDRFTPEIKATFTRPREDNETIVITTEQPGDFHLDAGTLQVVATILGNLEPNRKLTIGN